ncbi:MAG: YceI family protein, partial [Chloroflexi bacterium]|nr:YceI family protein [Chloroflexota bacterium]
PPTSTPLPLGALLTVEALEDFTVLFDAAAGRPRLVLFLTTGCSSCLAGARWLEEQLLRPHPELEVQVYAVWFAMVSPEFLPAELDGRRDESLLNDPRVIHFWDQQRLVNAWFAANVPLEGPERASLRRTYGQLDWGVYIWDAYFLYGPEGEWAGVAQAPAGAGYPIIQNRETIRAALAAGLEPATTTSPPAAGPAVFHIVPADSFVYYGVHETFAGRKFNYAIGVTSSITGQITFDPANPLASQVGPITVNIREFQSDNFLRDERIQQAFLESNLYPLAIFTPTEIHGLPVSYTPGETVTFEIVGDLTVRETIAPTTFTVSARFENGRLVGVATAQVLMTGFGFDPPVVVDLIAANNEVDITFEFVAEP